MISATVDTNILIYAVDVDAGEKHVRSALLVEFLSRLQSILPLQALSEFYSATTKKRTLAAVEAASFVHQFRISMQVVPYTVEDLNAAVRIHQQHHLQFFDALMVATARRAGCITFFTEDMQHGRTLEGITLVNPFHLSPEQFDDLIS